MTAMVPSATCQELLDDLQPELADDPQTQNVLQVIANEFDRVTARANALVQQSFPQNADDSFGMLSRFEGLYGLPVAPAGVSVATRQTTVLAAVRERVVSSGADWIELITTLLGTPSWTHTVVGYLVTIRVPYAAGSYTGAQLIRIARRVTPAHLDLAAGYSDGFLVGISDIGDAL